MRTLRTYELRTPLGNIEDLVGTHWEHGENTKPQNISTAPLPPKEPSTRE
jgi:hypothetical protein